MTSRPTYEELERRVQELQQSESDRRRSEEQLIHSHDLLDYIISHARSAIAVFDRDFKYIYVSKRYLRDYRVEEQNIIGKHHYEVLPDIPQKWRTVHQRALAGEVLSSEEDPYYREDGSIDWTRWECRPWYESDGSIGGIIIYNEIINERKQIEETLRNSEQLLSTHLLYTPVGAVFLDLDFKVVDWNPAAETIFGYARDETIGKDILELIVPEDNQKLVAGVFKDMLEGKGGKRSVNENIIRTGKRIQCDWYNAVLKNADGELIGVASLVNDITDRKRSEDINKTLFAISNAVNTTLNLNDLYRQIHHLLKDVINARNFFIAIVDEKKHLLYFPYYEDDLDDDFRTVTNFNPEKSLTGLVVLKRGPLLLDTRELKKLSAQNKVWGPLPKVWMGAPLIIKNEVIGVISVYSYTDPYLYSDHDLKVLSSISDQVAIAIDRKRTEDELRESEKRYRHLFDNAPAGMYEIDFTKPGFIEVNSLLCKYTGYTEEEFLSMEPLDLLTESSRKEFLKRHNALLCGEKLSNHAEYDIICKGGEKLCVVLNSDYIYENGKLTGAMVVVHDITERKKIENMIIQSEKMMSVGGLAAGMAHEINNPLAGMMQNAQVIHNRLTKDMPANSEVARELGTSMNVIKKFMEKRGILNQLESINTAGIRAARIIENMLSFSKKSNLSKTEEKLDELIDKTIELSKNDYDLKKKYDFKNIEIVRDYHPDVPPVSCEGSKIQQVLFNIIKNASEAMCHNNRPDTPKLIFRLSRQSETVRIEIEDNGPGIDQETRKRIFEPFFTTKSVGKGTGLGLSVSYFIIVDDHKGKLDVESVPGMGTKFIIQLPVGPGEEK